MRVVISGYYGFGNVGDEALLAGLVAGLQQRGHRIVVLSANPGQTVRDHRVRATHRVWGAPWAIARADAVVSGGGGLLQDATSARSLRYYLAVVGLARRLGKRVVIYGQSLGPLSPAGRAAVARALAGLPLAVRDEASAALARTLGAHPALVADPALTLPAPARAAATAGPVVLVPRGGQDRLNQALAELGRSLAADGVPVVALALHPAEDDGALQRLVQAVPSIAVRVVTDAASTMAAMVDARYVVSVRLHGCILAACVGVGFAGLSYDPKVRGFLEQARAPTFETPVDARSLRELARLGPPPEAHAVHHLRALAEEGIAWLDATLRA